MKKLFIKGAIACALLPCAHQAAWAEAESVTDMLSDGTVKLNFRYRYEIVDQDGIDEEAAASTLKTRLSWKSAMYNGFGAGIEMDNVTVIGGEEYRTPTNGRTEYPIVADPAGTDLNQAYISYKTEGSTTTAVRQRILHSGQRFVGGVGWRQNEQTYDALRFQMPSLGPVSLDYSYIWDVNRIFGPQDSAAQANKWESDSHALLLGFSPAEGHKINVFSYLLDFENAAANSTSTYGVEYMGKFGGFSLSAALADQSDAGDNPVEYSASYYLLEAGFGVGNFSFGAGMEVLGSDDGVAGFKTPLATLHKFQGWADKFLGTPATGIEDTYIKFGAKLGKVNTQLIYHDFAANEGGADYGTELNLVATYPFSKTASFQFKYASYEADSFSTDTDKIWLTLNYSF